MTWTPTRLTRAQLEERRLAGAKLLQAGELSQAEIARQLGVSRTAVSKWAQRLRTGGLRRLQRRVSTGRPSKLSRRQKYQLRQRLQQGRCGRVLLPIAGRSKESSSSLSATSPLSIIPTIWLACSTNSVLVFNNPPIARWNGMKPVLKRGANATGLE